MLKVFCFILALAAVSVSAQPTPGSLAEHLTRISAEQAAERGGDPTEPWRYFPLAVGNAWEYEFEFGDKDPIRMDIPKDTTINGTHYFILRQYRLTGPDAPTGFHIRSPVRFDTLAARLVRYSDFFGEERDTQLAPCVFTGGIGDEVACYQGVPGTVEFLTSSGSVTFGDGPTVSGLRIKEYYSNFRTHGYAADFGEIYGEGEGIFPYEITFCRIGGVAYGEERFPVASEDGTPPSGEALHLSVWPNPARGPVTVAFALDGSGAAVLEVVDVLGRIAHRMAVPAGEHRREITLATHTLAPGRYLVRLVTDGDAVATRPLTIQR